VFGEIEEFLRNFSKNESQNCDSPKVSHLGDQLWGISREFPRNQLQEMIVEKFLGNSSKKSPHLENLGKFPTFDTLGAFTFRSSFQCKLHKKQEIVTDMFRDHTVLL